jgi:hypothetical protein
VICLGVSFVVVAWYDGAAQEPADSDKESVTAMLPKPPPKPTPAQCRHTPERPQQTQPQVVRVVVPGRVGRRGRVCWPSTHSPISRHSSGLGGVRTLGVLTADASV